MSTAYLNLNATDLAAANWSDTTGFANGATLVINQGSQTITTNLNQSAYSITSLDVLGQFTGNIGSASAGPLKVDAQYTTESAVTILSRIRYKAGGGTMYFQANGTYNTAHYVQIDTVGKFYGLGGLFKNLHLDNGSLSINDQVTATGGIWYFNGGSAVVDYSTNLLNTLYVTGGSHTLNRAGTTINVSGGSVVIDCQGSNITTLTVSGSGVVSLRNFGTITTLNAFAGTLDLSRLQRPATVTTLNLGPTTRYYRSPLLTVTNAQPIGSAAF